MVQGPREFAEGVVIGMNSFLRHSVGGIVRAASKVCYLVTWLPGYLVTWLLGYLVTRLPGYLVTWLPGYLVTWSPGYLVTWLPGYNH